MNEIWKPVANFPGYEASNHGRVRTNKLRVKMMKDYVDKFGYKRITLRNDEQKVKLFFVHKLVLETFVGERPDGYVCEHINGGRTDNRLENLRWIPISQSKLTPNKRLRAIFAKTRKVKGCIEWTGSTFKCGYAKISYKHKNYIGSRLVWTLTHGDPKELNVCHSCDNRLCINPDHLWLGTHQDNMDDMARKGRRRSGKKALSEVEK